MKSRSLPLCLGVVLAACSGDPAQTSRNGPTTPETYPLREWPDIRLSITEDLRIDGLEEDLVRIARMAVREDGTMALVQDLDHEIRLFGPDGSDLGSVGREGEGPGEFTGINRLGWHGDSLWVYDARQGRFSVFGPDGSFEKGIPVDPLADFGAGQVRLFYRHLYPDGSTLAVHSPPQGSDEEDGGQLYVRSGPDGQRLRTLARRPSGAAFVGVRGDDFGASARIPFARDPEADVSTDGRRVAVVEPFMDGPAEGSFAVSVVHEAGDTAFALRFPFDPEPIPSAVADSAVAARLEALPDVPGMEAAFRDQVDVPPYYPPLYQVLVGLDGTIWIRMRGTQEGNPYRILSAYGDPVGTLVIPGGHVIAEAERSAVWVYEWNELDVQSVVRYRVAGGSP